MKTKETIDNAKMTVTAVLQERLDKMRQTADLLISTNGHLKEIDEQIRARPLNIKEQVQNELAIPIKLAADSCQQLDDQVRSVNQPAGQQTGKNTKTAEYCHVRIRIFGRRADYRMSISSLAYTLATLALTIALIYLGHEFMALMLTPAVMWFGFTTFAEDSSGQQKYVLELGGATLERGRFLPRMGNRWPHRFGENGKRRSPQSFMP